MANRLSETIVLDIQTKGLDNARRARNEIKATGDAVSEAAADFRSLAGAFTGMVVASKIKGLISSIIKPASEVEMALKQIQALTGATDETISKFQAKMIEGASRTKYSQTEAAQAMLLLQRATGDTDFTLKGLNQTLQIAQTTFGALNTSETAAILAQLRTSFGLTGDAAVVASDQMLRGAIKVGVGFEHFKGVLGKLGIGAMNADQSFKDTISTFLLFDKNLRNPKRSVQNVFTMLAELKTDKVQKAFSGLFSKPIYDSMTGVTMGLRDFFQEMVKISSTPEGFQAIKEAISAGFGKEAIRPILAIVGALREGGGIKVWDELQNEMVNGTKSARSLAEEALKPVESQLELSKEAAQNFAITLGSTVAPAVIVMAKASKGFLDLLNAIVSNPVGKVIVGIGLSVGMLGASLFALKATLFGVVQILAATGVNLIQARSFTHQLRSSVNALKNAYNGLATAAETAGAATVKAGMAGSAATPAGSALKRGLVKGGLLTALTAATGFAASKGTTPQDALDVMKLGLSYLSPGGEFIRPEGGDFERARNLAFRRTLGGNFNSMSTQKQLERIDKLLKEKGTTTQAFAGAFSAFGFYTETVRLEKLREKTQEKLMKEQVQAAEKAKKLQEDAARETGRQLLIGSKAFMEATKQLLGLVKTTPEVTQVQQMAKLEREFRMVGGAKAGQVIRGRRMTAGDISAAQGGVKALANYRDLIVRQARGEQIPEAAFARALSEVTVGFKALQAATFDPRSKKIQEEISQGFLQPQLVSKSAEQQKASRVAQVGQGLIKPTDPQIKEMLPGLNAKVPDMQGGAKATASGQPSTYFKIEPLKQSIDNLNKSVTELHRQMRDGVKTDGGDPKNSGQMSSSQPLMYTW